MIRTPIAGRREPTRGEVDASLGTLARIARQQALTMLLPRLRPAVRRRQRREVIVLIPAHNEEAAISGTLAGLRKQIRPPDWVVATGHYLSNIIVYAREVAAGGRLR